MNKAKQRVQAALAILVTLALLATAVYYHYDATHPDTGSAAGTTEPQQEQTITIAYLPITHAIPLFKAKELLEQEGNVKVELVRYGGWAELMDALNSGRVDGASVLIEMAMESRDQGIPLKLALLGHHDGNVVVGSNAIKTGADLKGKTIAIPNRQSSHNILVQQLLNENSLSTSDATLVEMAPAEMPAALKSGQIDAYCVAEPFGAKAISSDVGHVLKTSSELWPDSICCGIVLNENAVANKQDAIAAFEDAYREAGNSITKDDAVAIAEADLGQDAATSALSVDWISFNDLDVTRESYETLRDQVKKYGLNDNPPTYDEFVEQH